MNRTNCCYIKSYNEKLVSSSQGIFVYLIVLALGFYSFFSALTISLYTIVHIIAALVTICLISCIKCIKMNITYSLWIVNICIIFLFMVSSGKFVVHFNTYVFLLVLFGILLISQQNDRIICHAQIVKILVGFSIVSIVIIVLEMLLNEKMIPFLSALLPSDLLQKEIIKMSNRSGYNGLAEFANITSIAGAIIVCYSLYMIPEKKKVFKFVALILAIIGIVISHERSNFIIVPLCLVLTSFCKNTYGRSSGKIKILFIICLLSFLLFLLKPVLSQIPFFSRVFDTFDSLIKGEDISNGRDLLYNTAISNWLKKPLFGNRWFYFYANSYGMLGKEVYVHAHNIVLELLCDLGIVGTCIFISPMVLTLIHNIKAIRNSNSEHIRIYRFTLSIQVYFLLDSLVHVTFFEIHLVAFYFIIISVFYGTMVLDKEKTIRQKANLPDANYRRSRYIRA